MTESIKLLHMNLLAQGLSVDGFITWGSDVETTNDLSGEERINLNDELNKAEFITGAFRVGGQHIFDIIVNGELNQIKDDAVDAELILVSDKPKRFEIKRYPKNTKELLMIQKLIYPCIKNGFAKNVSFTDFNTKDKQNWIPTYMKSQFLQKANEHIPNYPNEKESKWYNLTSSNDSQTIANIPKKADDEPGWVALQKLVGVDDNGPHS